MPLSVGGKTLGPSNAQLLDWMAALWVEATELGNELRRLDAKRQRQNAWLDAHRDDPRYPERVHRAIDTANAFERCHVAIHNLAKRANEVTGMMDTATKAEAQRSIHAWAVIGSPGVYALAFDLVPDKAWLEDAEAARA